MENAIVNGREIPLSDDEMAEAKALCDIMCQTPGPVLAKAMELMSGNAECLAEYAASIIR